jgi:hypothetical protein
MEVKKGRDVVLHGIQVILDAHPNWVALQVDLINVFNTISCKVIF